MEEQLTHPRVKLLYDIYHMQIMEGDIIRTVARRINTSATFTPAVFPAATDQTIPKSFSGRRSPKPSPT